MTFLKLRLPGDTTEAGRNLTSDMKEIPRKEPPVIDTKRHFRIDHVKADLKGHAVRGGAVMMSTQAGKSLLIAFSTMILARLLTPSDFGLVAMVTSIMGLFAAFRDLGLPMATIQRAELNHNQVSTVFWVNVSFSALMMLLVMAISPAISRFYKEPRLTAITIAMASVFLLKGLGVQHQALLNRQMRFTALAAIRLSAMLAGFVATGLLAWSGVDYWALVFGDIITAVVACVAVWMISGWCPGPPVRHSNIRSMLAFGGHLTAYRFINYFANNLDKVLIGQVWGTSQLGLYIKPYRLLIKRSRQAVASISQVAIATLSRLQGEKERYRTYYRKGVLYTLALDMPILVFLSVDADRFILLALGKQWLSAVPIFQILVVGAFARAFNPSTRWVYLSLGRTDRQLRWGILQTAITALSFIIGVRWGASGVASAFSITACVLLIPSLVYCFKGTFLRLRDFLGSIWRPVLASMTAGFGLFIVRTIYHLGGAIAIVLVVDFAMFVLFNALVWLMMPNGWQIAKEAIELFRELRRSPETA